MTETLHPKNTLDDLALDLTGDVRGPVCTAGRVVAQGAALALAVGERLWPLREAGVCQEGDLIEIEGRLTPEGLSAQHVHRLVAGESDGFDPRRLAALRARARMNKTIRRYFDSRDFVEVETPNLVPSAGTDVYLEAFASRFSGMGQVAPADLYLHTSPEFFMKELLVAGAHRIYQICKAYRNGEVTASHNPEFTILEFYRAYEDFVPIMADVEEVVRAVLSTDILEHQGSTVDLSLPFERKRVSEVFEELCGLDILALDDAPKLREAAEAAGLGPMSAGGSWSDLFHQLMVTHIEPRLGAARPVFLTHYPRPLAVLSRACDDEPHLAERFELYVAGIELCNGFTELNDPVEQRARFAEDLDERARLGFASYPMPERFLASLGRGMPPAAGVAVGLDRLLMLASDAADIGEVLMRAVS